MNTLQKIDLENRQRREDRKNLPYETFQKSFLDSIRTHPERFVPDVFSERDGKLISHVRYGRGSSAAVLKEPLEWISIFSEIIDNTEACCRLMKALIAGNTKQAISICRQNPSDFYEICQQISLKTAPKKNIWFNSSENGICLRPGYVNGSSINLTPVTLNDTNVHMLAGGRTGGGKSVALDAMLMNVMTEYSPWELSLILIDFKKVELSRYMNQVQAPHVRILAATDEKSYVISVLQYLKDCMMARQDLFTYLGVKKISEFRQKYNVVLPRILVVCDEFQQLFQNTSAKQNYDIHSILNALIRMGRNTGVHLLFCSQDMSQTVSAKLLTGFKVRCSLPCDSEVSSEIIGNKAAAFLETGTLIINCSGGDEKANICYRVPLLSDGSEESDTIFQNHLSLLNDCTSRYGYVPVQKFYQQEKQEDISELKQILNHPDVIRERDLLLQDHPQYRELITLGPSVVYRSEEHDIEQLALSSDGLNQNILAVCDTAEDCAYLENLFVENLVTSSRFTGQENILFDHSLAVQAYYMLADHIPVKVYDSDEDLNKIRILYAKRKSFLKACRHESTVEFIKTYTDSMAAILQDQRKYSEYQAVLHGLFSSTSAGDIPDLYQEIIRERPERSTLIEPVYDYWRFSCKGESINSILPFMNVWISGIETLERLPGWLNDVLKYSMNARMTFMIFSASSDIPMGELAQRCDYIFLCTNNDSAYQRCHMAARNSSDIVIDYRIQSRDHSGAFKKYRTAYKSKGYPRINYDRILSKKERRSR